MTSIKVCNHVIAVYSENKLQHYATVYRNHKSADEKLGLSDFVSFLRICSANTLQPVQMSIFNWTATRLECSRQAVAYISHIWHGKSLNLCCLSKLTLSAFTIQYKACSDQSQGTTKITLNDYFRIYEGQSKNTWTILITCKTFDAIRSNLQILYLDTSEISLWRHIFTNITEWYIFISLYAPG